MANFKRRYPRKRGARRFWQSYTVLGRLHKHRKKDVPDTDLIDLQTSLDGVVEAHSPDGGEEEMRTLQGRPVEADEPASAKVDGDALKLLGT